MSNTSQRNQESARKYVIVSAVRDEAQHITKTLDSVIQQMVRPSEWIIVDDGSRDETGRIVDEYAKRYPWIVALHRADRGHRMPGSGVMQAFYDGFRRVESRDWEFIVKLDGDVELDADYFQRCFERFDEDSDLGICGGRNYSMKDGKLTLEPHPVFHVRGSHKLYRRSCWDAIGGLVVAVGWDTIDEVQANRLGWRTRSFADLKVLHHRPTGAEQGAWLDGVKMGKAAYVSGYHPFFMTVKCIRRIFQKPYVLCAAAHAYGFISSYVRRLPRVEDAQFLRYIRNQQIRRLFFLESIWK